MQKSINQLEKEWYDFFLANPSEVINMLAALLAVQGIELDEEETATPEGNQVSEQPAAEEGKHGGGDA